LTGSVAFEEVNSLAESILFRSLATIALITRCLVTGNMLINQTAAKRDAFSLLVLDDPNTTPAPQVMVSANVLQGRMDVTPEHYPATSNVPAPMNSWQFLNTVLQ
jgi:hypothetical protein